MVEKVYFDYNATKPLRKEVKEKMLALPLIPYNPSSAHSYGRHAKKLLTEARMEIINLLNISDQYHIIFTASGTETNNLVLNGLQDRVIITSPTEHPSILQNLENLNYEFIKINQDGMVDLEYYRQILIKYSGSGLVSIMMANNETGVIQDIQELARIAHEYKCLFHTDAIQALGKIPCNIRELEVDLITFSSHKIGGPLGVSLLIYKNGIDLKPIIRGGGQERNIRSGTENLVAILGFKEALELTLNEQELFYDHTSSLRDHLITSLKKIASDIIILGEDSNRLPNTICVTMPNVNSYTQVINLDLEGFAVSAGSACSSGTVKASNVITNMGYSKEIANSSIRISLDLENTLEEIDLFLVKWKEIYKRLSVKADAA